MDGGGDRRTIGPGGDGNLMKEIMEALMGFQMEMVKNSKIIMCFYI